MKRLPPQTNLFLLTAGFCYEEGSACLTMIAAAAAAAKSLQSYPTLCDPIDGNPPGSPIPGILQARTLEWVAISFSSKWKWKVKVKLLSLVRSSATPWTAAFQVLPSMGFSRQEYWSGLPLSSLLTMIIFLLSLPEPQGAILRYSPGWVQGGKAHEIMGASLSLQYLGVFLLSS